MKWFCFVVLFLLCGACAPDLYREKEPSYKGREGLEGVRFKRTRPHPSLLRGEGVAGVAIMDSGYVGPSFKILLGVEAAWVRPIVGLGFHYIPIEDIASMTALSIPMGIGIGPKNLELRALLRPSLVHVRVHGLPSQSRFGIPTSLGFRVRTDTAPSFGLEVSGVKDWRGRALMYEMGLSLTF